MSCGSLTRSCALNPVYAQAHQGVTKSCGNPSENENTCLQFRTFAALRCHASRLGAHEMSHCEEERNSDGEASRSVCAVGTLAVSHLRYQQHCEPASNSSHSCDSLFNGQHVFAPHRIVRRHPDRAHRWLHQWSYRPPMGTKHVP